MYQFKSVFFSRFQNARQQFLNPNIQFINMNEEPTIFSILLESIQAVMSIAGFVGKELNHSVEKAKIHFWKNFVKSIYFHYFR